ncbi:hypothetical protein RB595_005457 [Gaeumannomyces hyphopodioides]
MCTSHGQEQPPPTGHETPTAAAAAADSSLQEPFPWDAGVYDAHCHPTTTPASVAAIPGMRARAVAVMSSRAQDQDLVAAAAEAQGHGAVEGGKVLPAFGYHPWSSHLVYDDTGTAAPTFDPDAAAAGGREALDAQLARHYGAVLRPSAAGDGAFTSRMPVPEPLSAVVAATRARLARFPRALLGEVGLDKAFRLPQPREPGPDGEPDPPADDERDLAPGGRYGRRLSRYRVSMPHQERVLAAQLAVAAELGRPVSVHGVQCQGVLFDALTATWKGHEREVLSRRQRALVAKGAEEYEVYDSDEDEGEGEGEGEGEHEHEYGSSTRQSAAPAAKARATGDGMQQQQQTTAAPKPYPPRICLHSFGGSVETMKQYLDPRIPARIYFSFSSAINLSTPTGGERVPDAIGSCPDDRILLETDLPVAGDEMDAALEHIYRAVCEIKGWGLREGVERIARNFEEFAFGP